jgi:methylmalonyl-CoA mutase N-terminal domain/subunit
VGVNEFVDEHERPIEILKIGPEIEESQIAAIGNLRGRRDEEASAAALAGLKSAAADESENLMPPLIDCARAYCTEGEIVGALREVFGEYVETPRF